MIDLVLVLKSPPCTFKEAFFATKVLQTRLKQVSFYLAKVRNTRKKEPKMVRNGRTKVQPLDKAGWSFVSQNSTIIWHFTQVILLLHSSVSFHDYCPNYSSVFYLEKPFSFYSFHSSFYWWLPVCFKSCWDYQALKVNPVYIYLFPVPLWNGLLLLSVEALWVKKVGMGPWRAFGERTELICFGTFYSIQYCLFYILDFFNKH